MAQPPCMWLIDNHVRRDVPTTWPRSVPRKVAPQLTTTVGWPTAGDRQGRVRAGLSLLHNSDNENLNSPKQCSAGGTGGPDGLETAWGTLELRFERGSNVARRPSACGRMRLVAELLLGPQTPCMPPRSIPGVPFHSDRLSPPWVPKGVHWVVWVIGPHTHRG